MAINLGIALFALGQYIFFVRNDGDGLQGDWLCYGMYYTAVVMYKPFSLNMMWLLTNCIMYAFTDIFYDRSPRKAHQRDALGTPVSYGYSTVMRVYIQCLTSTGHASELNIQQPTTPTVTHAGPAHARPCLPPPVAFHQLHNRPLTPSTNPLTPP